MKKKESKIGIIGGKALEGISGRKRLISTPYGKAEYFSLGNSVLIYRHGEKSNIPPHKINHRANIFGLKKIGVKKIFAFNSVGSLKKNLRPGRFFIPDDFIDFDPPTFFDKKLIFVSPAISSRLRAVFLKVLKKLGMEFFDGGVYFNSRGPRLETRAEIRMISSFADVVGMTMAKEATLSNEMGIDYASLCSIDNLGQGIGKRPLRQKDIGDLQKKNKGKIKKIVEEILKLE